MTTYTDVATKPYEYALASLEQARELSVRTVEAGLALVPAETPLASEVASSTKQFVKAGFVLAERLLEQQKAYATRVSELMESAPARTGK